MRIYCFKSYKNKNRNTNDFAKEAVIEYINAEKLHIEGDNNINISRTEAGKPFIRDFNIFLSISHSQDICVIAVSNQEIGIDIEKIRDINWKRISDKYFTQAEKSYLENNLSTNVFFEIWTRKEAYAKLLGISLMEIIRKVSLLNYDFDNENELYFSKLKIDKDYSCVVCYNNTEKEIIYECKK